MPVIFSITGLLRNASAFRDGSLSIGVQFAPNANFISELLPLHWAK
jgi:hypothetical protein